MSDHSNEIQPFPETIDREMFGWYISGFTDGEGCFALLLDSRTGKRWHVRPTPSASFALNLRRDDNGVLKLIQSFFQCGRIVYGRTTKQCTLRFRTKTDLKVIVDHFDKFNLFAKKRADFILWKEGVGLMLQVAQRKQKRSQRYGSGYKWLAEEHERFVLLKERLSEGRKLKAVVQDG